jgi:hypothetical protein
MCVLQLLLILAISNIQLCQQFAQPQQQIKVRLAAAATVTPSGRVS